jgi:hypothetical protein
MPDIFGSAGNLQASTLDRSGSEYIADFNMRFEDRQPVSQLGYLKVCLISIKLPKTTRTWSICGRLFVDDLAGAWQSNLIPSL